MGVKSGDELRHDLASVISRCSVPKVTWFHYISSSLFHLTFSSFSIFHLSADYSVPFFRLTFEKIWHSTSRNQLFTAVESWIHVSDPDQPRASMKFDWNKQARPKRLPFAFVKGAMSLGYCYFRLNLCWNDLLSTFAHTKWSARDMKKISPISWGRSNRHIFFGDVFAGIAFNLKRLAYLVNSQSISILSIRCEETTGNSCTT